MKLTDWALESPWSGNFDAFARSGARNSRRFDAAERLGFEALGFEEMLSRKIDVVAAVIEREGRFLIGKRSSHKRSAPGYWCPISGHIEAGESHAEAVVREVREEAGLSVEAVEKLAECDTHDGSAVIHWWRVRPLNDAPARLANDEHSALVWVTPEEMRRLEPVFLEDVAILEKALSGRAPTAPVPLR
jgi:8-oxo-dGTP diphosphatase